MEGLEVQIMELQSDLKKLREQLKLDRNRWKEEKASSLQVQSSQVFSCKDEYSSMYLYNGLTTNRPRVNYYLTCTHTEALKMKICSL